MRTASTYTPSFVNDTDPDAADRQFGILSHKLRSEIAPIRNFLDDRTVTDVIVRPQADPVVWVKRFGEAIAPTGVRLPHFRVRQILTTIASMHGTFINEARCELHAELPTFGHRVAGMLPPVSRFPTIAIRNHSETLSTLEDYVADGMMTQAQADYLRQTISERKLIVFAGATGSGKTHLMRTCIKLAGDMYPSDGLAFVYDIDENLDSLCPNSVGFKINAEAGMTGARAVKECLRHNVTRLIYGEARDGESVQAFLRAANTGHPGGYTSVHANGIEDGLLSLEQMIVNSGGNPSPALIARLCNVVVFLVSRNNKPFVHSIGEVTGFENGRYVFSEV